MDEDKYRNLPIPTYEEATSSRPTSSQGPEEASDDAERQGLLEQARYHQPTVDSARSSEDSDLRLPEVGADDDRRQIEELDYLDPSADGSQRQRGLYHRARLRGQWSKRLANISATFSSLRIPSLRSLYTPVSSGDDSDSRDPPSDPPPARSRWLPTRNPLPEEYRVSAPNVARLCGLFMIGAMIYALFALDMFPNRRRRMGAHFDPESVRQFVQEHVDGNNIARYLHHITSYDHVAGTEGDLYLAKWMQEQWVEEGAFDEVSLQSYYVYLDYPTADGRSVKIVHPERKKWKAKLEEKQVDNQKQQTFAWHAHSKSGETRGPLVYANSGSREDFAWLKENGVQTTGAVALIRYGGAQPNPGLKVKAAEEAGCAGVLLYSDKDDDGRGKGEAYPNGPWRSEDSVQRASVSFGSYVVGDPLSPGWASRKKHDRTKIDDNAALPKIPSLPLSWRDGQVLLQSLDRQGTKVPPSWIIDPQSGRGEITFTGGKPANVSDDDGKWVIVELKNNNEFSEQQEIWNLHGLIQGIESPEKRVVVGSHRDSFCFGAVDPGSGSAVMMEVASIFLSLRKLGWRPLRTIEFASWDAGAYNNIGSTEFVEDNLGYLQDHGIAYLNVDAGVSGNDFRASGSPLFKKAFMHVLKRVVDPVSNSTLRQLWNKNGAALAGLGGGGDYVPFQDMAGMSSVDFGFEGPPGGFPKGSCYETFEWMQKFGDNGFQYHRTLAQIWALLILEISDRPLIPFNLNAYAGAIAGFVDNLQQDAQETYSRLNDGRKVKGAKQLTEMTASNKNSFAGFDLSPLRKAVTNMTANIESFSRFEDLWMSNVLGAGGLESGNFAIQRLDYNDRIARFESDLLDLPYKHGDKGMHGIPGREQFVHVLFAPSKVDGGVEVWPAVRDALEQGDWEAAQRMVERAASVIERAGRKLME
ncbi:uncharacterized protein LTR77_005905 [Saxophila tyrrhenica]|uniref:Uncharacterized protein n=1 Tax=Saxophila tyrrhenica TaxID=1690608 RepID=A0AAV9PCX3_9PEZI|nr:hypothetical protein LTR77_005905 [Saxophila tyrrhenica]